MFLRDFAATDKIFIRACEIGGVKPTRRQASRYRHNRGTANSFRNQSTKEQAPIKAEGRS